MKEWRNPEIQELEFANTQWDATEGTIPDSDIVDHNTGEVKGPWMYSL
jgi:hypothetical protein